MSGSGADTDGGAGADGKAKMNAMVMAAFIEALTALVSPVPVFVLKPRESNVVLRLAASHCFLPTVNLLSGW